MILWSEYDDNDDDKETREIDNDDGNNNIAAHRDKGWFHIDQNPHTKTKFTSIQGLVNLLPVLGSTCGNVLAMGSHKRFPAHLSTTKVETTTISTKEIF